MKNSEKEDKLLDFERDLPTRIEDILAQRQYRDFPLVALEDYLQFLKSLGPASPEVLRSRKGPRGEKPFVLPSTD